MFPLPLCATCADLRVCASVGEARPGYPRCRRPLLGTRLDRLRSLVEKTQPDGRLATTVEVLVDRFAIDRNRYSEIFEWSLAWDVRGVQQMRFSYAFPGWPADRSICATLVAAAPPWAAELTARVLAIIAHPAIAQPLIGVADDGPRYKLYLQLQAQHDLHLIGLDVDPTGMVACKLYYATEAPAGPLVDALGIRRALVVHRSTSAVPTELDFGLVDNDLTEAQALEAAAKIYPDAVAAYRRLAASYGLALRRISVGLDRPRLVLYYVLTDSDAKPPAGG